jgi:hypothetical protein
MKIEETLKMKSARNENRRRGENESSEENIEKKKLMSKWRNKYNKAMKDEERKA